MGGGLVPTVTGRPFHAFPFLIVKNHQKAMPPSSFPCSVIKYPQDEGKRFPLYRTWLTSLNDLFVV